jgi:hypothetical protein
MENTPNEIIGWLSLPEAILNNLKQLYKNKRWFLLVVEFLILAILLVSGISWAVTLIRSAWFSHATSTYSILLDHSQTDGGLFVAGNQTYNYYNQSSSTPPSVSGTIQLNSGSIHKTFNDIFNLSPLIFTPPGPSVTLSSELATSTIGEDGLYHTNLRLEILTLPDVVVPVPTSIIPPSDIVCTKPFLKEIGIMLGGQYTGRLDHAYDMSCSSNEQIATSTEFQVIFKN